MNYCFGQEFKRWCIFMVACFVVPFGKWSPWLLDLFNRRKDKTLLFVTQMVSVQSSAAACANREQSPLAPQLFSVTELKRDIKPILMLCRTHRFLTSHNVALETSPIRNELWVPQLELQACVQPISYHKRILVIDHSVQGTFQKSHPLIYLSICIDGPDWPWRLYQYV